MSVLFIEGILASDEIYNLVRDAKNSQCADAQKSTETLWKRFQKFADPHFRTEIQKDFESRYWEMYLTCSIEDIGYSVSCPKPGPDVQVIVGENTIWLEAIAPSSGQLYNPDKVSDHEFGVVRNVPDSEIILRYSSAIKEKFDHKYWKYRDKKIISGTDVYVIAITGCKISHSNKEREIPRIVRSVFPIGDLQVSVDTKTFEFTDTSYTYKPEITRKSGATVSTSLFTDEKYKYLSAILFSNVNAINTPEKLGSDFIIVHNPHAVNKIPSGFINRGLKYSAAIENGEYTLNFKNLNI